MHLQSLELLGFKSFADKTTFHFHEGVTAIVGPNGCGKSNLLDAVRWVLGEQSAKSLRGGEMADVIFNGTDSRKPHGFAEVSLSFTDCEAELEVDWNEVRVTRRVYRDGNSEYFLNKTACRLRDIQNLFADTGVARAAYSMMEQGKIDMILSSRPEDRRAVFEEAAGITKYKTQKREALRKLEATEANLLRVGDIIKEVKRQIGSLQRQAGKARRYQALHVDLRTLDTHYSRKKLEALETDLANCRKGIERLGESEHKSREKIDIDENELTELRRALEHTDARIADGRTEFQRLESEIAMYRSRIEFNRLRRDETTALIERTRKDIAAAEAKRAAQHEEIERADTLLEKTRQLLETKERELKEQTELISQLRVQRNAHAAELESLQLAFSANEIRIDETEDEISGITIRRETTRENQCELDAAISKADNERAKIEKEIGAARSVVERSQEDVDLFKSEARGCEETLQQHQQLLASAEDRLAATERALTEKESRLEILRQLNDEGEGLAQGSQAVLKGLDDPSRFQPALAGAFVSQLDVDPRFIAAIEAALGRNLQAIVLRDPQLAPEIIAKLKMKKLGQAALVIPTLCNSEPKKHAKHLPNKSLGWAVDKVKAPDSLARLVSQLLHNVALFESLDHALAARQENGAIAAATLAGEFISSEGIVFAGTSEIAADSLLERKARISMLKTEHSALCGQRDALRQERDETKTGLDKATHNFGQARIRSETADRERSGAENRLVLLERERDELERRIESLRAERITLAQQIDAADQRVAQLEAQLESVRAEFGEKQARKGDIESARNELSTRENEAAEKLNELRLALATERQRYDSLVTQRQPMTARETELAETIAARGAEIADFEKRLATQADESKNAEAAIERQTAHCSELAKSLAALGDERAKKSSAATEMESSLRNVRNSLSDLHDLRAKQQVRESQLQMQVDNLAEHVQRRYQVDLREFTPDQAAFEKVLRVQLKKRGATDEVAADLGSARASRAAVGALADDEPGTELAHDDDLGKGTRAKEFGEGAEINTRGRVCSPDKLDLRDEELQQLIAQLTQRLDEMGPVNLDAVHEYDELEERYKFLESQNNDLTNSRRELLDVISKINTTTRKLFAETFEQVRANFREIFSEMFGGGRADLSLMDENDPLNCGIEISAKPPGKQLQSVSLLSGGERAMTAVALLFGIYMVRPSPFCVLDEIDAPLDESNINRFIHVLERFVEQSQFIIITHNKRTIAKADILYGVTMEERGVSKLVGMKLTQSRETAMETTSNGNGHGETATQRHLALAAR